MKSNNKTITALTMVLLLTATALHTQADELVFVLQVNFDSVSP